MTVLRGLIDLTGCKSLLSEVVSLDTDVVTDKVSKMCSVRGIFSEDEL
jgi:hypothetical protein